MRTALAGAGAFGVKHLEGLARIDGVEVVSHRPCREPRAQRRRRRDPVQIDVSRVDVSMNGIELQDREFIAAIREKREPGASAAAVLPCYQVLHRPEQQL